MATLRERFQNWKETRKGWQKFGDILFWLLLVLLIIPGPRKVVATTVNRLALNFRTPSATKLENQQITNPEDFEWKMIDDKGNHIAMKQYAGKVIFLNLWATWCPPCIAELPEIENLYKKYGDQVVFLLVTNDDPDRVNEFLTKKGYNLPVHYSVSTPPIIFSNRSIPTTYIISANGHIVLKKTGAANWDSRATNKIFKELLN